MMATWNDRLVFLTSLTRNKRSFVRWVTRLTIFLFVTLCLAVVALIFDSISPPPTLIAIGVWMKVGVILALVSAIALLALCIAVWIDLYKPDLTTRGA